MTPAALTHLAAHVVAAVCAELPEPLHAFAKKLPVAYPQHPTPEILGEEFEPDILGLFVGSPHGLDRGDNNDVPAQIFLFLGNLWDFAEEDEDTFADEVRLTYLHELGHYFGWDEDDLAARELD
jgi:predicted Zn-dependent protease with MMP-like domain